METSNRRFLELERFFFFFFFYLIDFLQSILIENYK